MIIILVFYMCGSMFFLILNGVQICEILKEAAAAGAKLLCFPESFSYIGANLGDSVKIAEPLDGPTMQGYCSLARWGLIYFKPCEVVITDQSSNAFSLILLYPFSLAYSFRYFHEMTPGLLCGLLTNVII